MSKTIDPIILSQPDMNNSVSLMQAFATRRTNRDFDSAPLSTDILSGLFWAAYGKNRPDGHKTVPAAWGLYALKVYAVMPEGTYLYNAKEQRLEGVQEGDFRREAGMQDFVTGAPLDIVIMYDEALLQLDDKDMNKLLHRNVDRVVALDAGAVAQNIYLYCAANRLNVVERMMVSEDAFRKAVGLSKKEHFVVALTVGYPPRS